MKKQFVITKDHSHTIYLPELDEHYHSVHGAVQESRHVFIQAGLPTGQAGLKEVGKNDISILEVGLGTGLNAFLTFLEAEKGEKNIHYTALEPAPLTYDEAAKLNYLSCLNEEAKKDVFEAIHTSLPDEVLELSSRFFFRKVITEVQQYCSAEQYDIIYYDAFAPRVQPELWTEAIFAKLYELLKKEGLLVTYCAKGSVKRALKKASFVVETLPGPPGKREMIRARKV